MILTKDPPGSPTWVSAHKGKIGGNMASDILGCGRHTRKHAWGVLTNRIHEDLSKLPHIQLGIALEPVVKSMWQQRLDRKLRDGPGLMQSDMHPWLCGDVDGIDDQTGGVFEAKSIGFWMRKEWKNGTPLRVQVQGNVYSNLLGNPGPIFYGAIALPQGKQEAEEVEEDDDDDEGQEYANDLLLWGQQDPDLAFQERMLNELGEFVARFVTKDVEPPAEDAKDLPIIKILHPMDDRSVRTFNESDARIVDEWKKLGAEAGAIRKHRKVLQTKICDKLGSATWAILPTGRPEKYVRWQAEPRKEHTVPASAPRILRAMKEMKTL